MTLEPGSMAGSAAQANLRRLPNPSVQVPGLLPPTPDPHPATAQERAQLPAALAWSPEPSQKRCFPSLPDKSHPPSYSFQP